MWSSVTVRLRNSHSLHLHTPGVSITRKPFPACLNPGCVVSWGALLYLPVTHGTGVVQHHHCRGMQSSVLLGVEEKVPSETAVFYKYKMFSLKKNRY